MHLPVLFVQQKSHIASAEETDTNTVTTVTLADTENGLMQFSEECMDASTANQDGYHMVQVGEDGQMKQIYQTSRKTHD